MKSIRLVLAVCAGLFLAPAVSAQTMLCSLRPNSPDIAMPPDVVVDFDGASATVAHGWIEGQRLHEVAVAENGNRRRMGFTLPFSVSSRTAMVHYTLTYFIDRQELRISANAGAGFEGNFRGVYGCNPVQR